MKHTNWKTFISAGILTVGVSVIPLTLPVSAQVSAPDADRILVVRDNDDAGAWGLWGLVGLAGLLGFMSKGKRRDAAQTEVPIYRDPNR